VGRFRSSSEDRGGTRVDLRVAKRPGAKVSGSKENGAGGTRVDSSYAFLHQPSSLGIMPGTDARVIVLLRPARELHKPTEHTHHVHTRRHAALQVHTRPAICIACHQLLRRRGASRRPWC
jgi:hypothetical protein